MAVPGIKTSALPTIVASSLAPTDILVALDVSDTAGTGGAATGTFKGVLRSGLLIPDANADVSLTAGAWSDSGAGTATGVLVGGNVNQATLFHVDHSYMALTDPLPQTSGGQLGVGFLYTGDIDLNYAGAGPSGPKQASGFFGPRGVFSNEATQTIYQDQNSYGHGPIGFMDSMMTRNVVGATRQFVGSYAFISSRMCAADGGAVTLKRNDVNDGLTAFYDNNVLVTAGSATMTATQGGDYTIQSFVSAPVVQGNVTLQRRVGFKVNDITGGVGAGSLFDAVPAIGGRLSGTVDDTNPTITEQIGVLIGRLTKATTNTGIQCDSAVKLWQDTVTFTANPPAQIVGISGTFTLGSGSDLSAKTYSSTATWIVDTTLNALSTMTSFYSGMNLRSNANATARNLKQRRGFHDNPTVKGDTSSDTMDTLASFVSSPSTGVLNSGFLAITDLNQFWAIGATAASGVTITNQRGLFIQDSISGGARTNVYGIDIERLTRGGTKNVGIRSNARVDLWDDTVTFTVNPDHIINVAGTWTISTGTDLPPRVMDVTSTLVVDTTLNSFAVPTMIRNAMTYKSDTSATARDLKQMRGFFDSPTVQADGSADTMANFSSFHSTPTFSVTGSGSPALALTDLQQFHADAGSIGSGVTITTYRGLRLKTPSGSGTVTNCYGIDVESVTKGGTKNRAIRVGTGGIEITSQNAGNETSTTNLPSSATCMYVKSNKLVFAYNDAGTITYVSLLLTGTGVTWVHSTTAP